MGEAHRVGLHLAQLESKVGQRVGAELDQGEAFAGLPDDVGHEFDGAGFDLEGGLRNRVSESTRAKRFDQGREMGQQLECQALLTG